MTRELPDASASGMVGGEGKVATERLPEAPVIPKPRRAARPEFFNATTIASLASLSAARRAEVPAVARPALVRRGIATAPLSFAQERVYRRALAGAGPDELHLSMVAQLRGELDVRALGLALELVVARHEALRVAVTDLQQTVQRPYRVALESAEELSLETGRLFDARLESRGSTEHVLTLTLHRIAADGVSSHIVTRDLALCYGAVRAGRRPELPALSLQHPDYARWERSTLTTVDSSVSEWLAERGDLSRLTSAPRPIGTRRVLLSEWLDSRDVRVLSTMARRHRCSPRTILQTIWATACSRHLCDDLLACVPVSGRDHPALHQVVGRFVNLAVVPVRLDGMSDFASRVELVGEAVKLAYLRERELPLLALEQAIDPDRPAAGPVFPLLLDVADAPAELPAIAGLGIIVRPPAEHTTDFGLVLQAQYERDGMELALLHDPELYSDELVTALLDEVLDGIR